MKKWTTEEEAEHLRQRFVGVNRAKFARDFGIKGGQANIYNHISGLRPINLDAARRYAKGFSCSLEEISPRLAAEVAAATPYSSKVQEPDVPAHISASARKTNWPFAGIDEEKVRGLPEEQLAKLEAAILVAAGYAGLDIKKD